MNESTYEVIEAPYEGAAEIIKRIDPDGKVWFIPVDEANADYQAYLESLNDNSEAE
jgi:hypothetical protein